MKMSEIVAVGVVRESRKFSGYPCIGRIARSSLRYSCFVNITDCMVSAVVEQFYSSTFKFWLLEMQEMCPMKRFTFTSKCTEMRLVAGLCPDPLRELTAPPNLLPIWIKRDGRGVGKVKGRDRAEGGEVVSGSI